MLGRKLHSGTFQTKGTSSWAGTSSFVLIVPLCSLRPSIIFFRTMWPDCAKGLYSRTYTKNNKVQFGWIGQNLIGYSRGTSKQHPAGMPPKILVYSRCADLKFDGGKEKVYQSTPISLYRTTRNNGIDYHFFILLLLDKEMIHSLVIRDFCEFLRIRLGKALNER